MISNKAILGFFVVLLLIVGAIVVVRRNPNLLTRFRTTTNQTSGRNVSPTPTKAQVAGTTTTTGGNQPAGLTACIPELKSQCSNGEAPVCGWERVITGGAETTRSLTFKSACNYCKLYGADDVLDLGDEKYYPLGYSVGACTASK